MDPWYMFTALQMEQDVLGDILDFKTLRSINRAGRKTAYVGYLRNILTKYISNRDAIVRYIRRHSEEEDIAYWVYDDIDSQDRTSVSCNIIGTVSKKYAVEYCKDNIGEQRYETEIDLNNLGEGSAIGVRMGYANLYNMAIEDRMLILQDEDIPGVFEKELKGVLLDMIDKDHKHTAPEYLYTWLYFNCVSVELDAVYNIDLPEDDSKVEIDRLYLLLRDTLKSHL